MPMAEDVNIVALARTNFWPDIDRRERAAASEHRPAVRPAIGLLGGAFEARGRVRVGEDDRPLVDRAIASITSRLNSFGTVLTPIMPVGLIAFDRRDDERIDPRRMLVCERFLEIGQVAAQWRPSIHLRPREPIARTPFFDRASALDAPWLR